MKGTAETSFFFLNGKRLALLSRQVHVANHVERESNLRFKNFPMRMGVAEPRIRMSVKGGVSAPPFSFSGCVPVLVGRRRL